MAFFRKLFHINSYPKQSKELSSLAFMQNPLAMLITDEKGNILNINDAFTQLTGYSEIDIVDQKMSLLKSGEYNHSFYKSFFEKLLQTGKHHLEIYNKCQDGSLKLMNERIVKIKTNEMVYYLITLEDITERKKLAERYQHLATHDPLTGLANRTLLEDRFKHALLNAQRTSKKLAILMCDLNKFKQLNDTYGHAFGDIALKSVAHKLSDYVRASDTIARFGGDEFTLILEQVEDRHDIEKFIDSLKVNFPMPLTCRDEVCEVNISIGYACFPDDGVTFNQLVHHADTKMYEEKNNFHKTEYLI